MYLSGIRIDNFRNFNSLDAALDGNIVIVGENRVGKSNLLFGLRLIFDPSLPDSSRQLGLSDFWDGIDELDDATTITISVDIKDFEADDDILALLSEYRLDDDAETVRLTYRLAAKPGLGRPPASDDFTFTCFGGENPSKRFGHDLRRRITMDLLPALRDAEGDLAAWRRSPLRPLVEAAFVSIDKAELAAIGEKIGEATAAVAEFDQVETLETGIAKLFTAMSGPKQDVKPTLGFSATDPSRIQRQIRILIDEGRRGLADASLGSANLVYLTLKLLDLERLIKANKRDHSLLAIEEPEAHLHPHVQRLVYKHVFETIVEDGDEDEDDDDEGPSRPLSVVLTTHSPHIASVAPITSLLLLREEPGSGTKGYSAAAAGLSTTDVEDLKRYLDVTRAELVFARGVILVEGDAERFLVPAFADELDVSLDEHGISVCSVAGTNFKPYVKLLCALKIPFAVITDYDEYNGYPQAYNRALQLIRIINDADSRDDTEGAIEYINELETYRESFDEAESFNIFVNDDTLEIELYDSEFSKEIIATLCEHSFGKDRMELLAEWVADPAVYDREKLLAMIEQMGKGRFAQRLVSRIGGHKVPGYIERAIRSVTDRV